MMMERTSLEKHILHLEKRLMNYDYHEFDEYLADDFVEFGSSGNTYDKHIQLAALRNRTTDNLIQFTVTDFQIKLLASNVVLATYRTFRHHDRHLALRSSIWRLTDGKWKMVFHQGTPTV